MKVIKKKKPIKKEVKPEVKEVKEEKNNPVVPIENAVDKNSPVYQ